MYRIFLCFFVEEIITKIMKTETFNALLSRLKRDTSDTDLSLGMRAKRQNYELNVYCEDAGEMQVECTCEDVEVNLTMGQIERIQYVFNEQLDQIEINIKNENVDGFTDDYDSTGTKQSDFY